MNLGVVNHTFTGTTWYQSSRVKTNYRMISYIKIQSYVEYK